MAAALPRSLGELQLYRILQRANLLCYYDAFIQQGGDDVQQLCEAGEEEFLEIMALVGVASKPLHVRRLQKALQDWVTKPALFNQPITSPPVCSIPVYKLPPDPQAEDPGEAKGSSAPPGGGSPQPEPRPGASPRESSPTSPREGLEALGVAAVRAVEECVDRMPRGHAAHAREQLRGNRKLARMIGHIFLMGEDDPRREEEVRKYSAIYGRFDSKRKDGKHLTLHELTVNEAAAQLCMRDVALLTRRDELFGMARQISREVTYKYSYRTSRSLCGDRDEPSPKSIRLEEGFFDLQEALQAIHVQQEALREQLAHAHSNGEETLGRNLQVQLEQLLSRQMEILQDTAAQERLQTLDWRIPAAAFKHGAERQRANGTPAEKHRDQQAESPLNLRLPNQKHRMIEGDTPLGRQLANELKRRHSTGESPTPTSETRKTANGNWTVSGSQPLNLSDRKAIKSEVQDSR